MTPPAAIVLMSSPITAAKPSHPVSLPSHPTPKPLSRSLSLPSSLSFNFPRIISSTTSISTRTPRFFSPAVALKSDSAASLSDDLQSPSSSSESEHEEDRELKLNAGKVGARVRVKVPLKVYHVPRVPEVELTGMEGVVKDFVGLWKGKRISANFPFRVEFKIDVEGRGSVKFNAHLREDEFEFV